MAVNGYSNVDSPNSIKKTSFPAVLKEKFKIKTPWSKSKDIDDETLHKVDIFIQDVIEKAKVEYLSECNGGNGYPYGLGKWYERIVSDA